LWVPLLDVTKQNSLNHHLGMTAIGALSALINLVRSENFKISKSQRSVHLRVVMTPDEFCLSMMPLMSGFCTALLRTLPQVSPLGTTYISRTTKYSGTSENSRVPRMTYNSPPREQCLPKAAPRRSGPLHRSFSLTCKEALLIWLS
jgi:hypothetical protein